MNHPLVLLTKVVFENQENFKKTSEEERVVNKMQDEATKNFDHSFCVLLRVGQYRYSKKYRFTEREAAAGGVLQEKLFLEFQQLY